MTRIVPIKTDTKLQFVLVVLTMNMIYAELVMIITIKKIYRMDYAKVVMKRKKRSVNENELFQRFGY